MLRPWIMNIFTALTNYIQILSRMKYFFFVFGKENGHHLISGCESLLPILVIEVFLNVLLATRFIFFDDKFIEGVFKNTMEYPFS